MTTRPLYEQGRASAAVIDTAGRRPGRADYDLVRHLRRVRDDGNETMTAAERYDPDFCLKLSACSTEGQADALIAEWLDRRVRALKHTRLEFKRVWKSARPVSHGH